MSDVAFAAGFDALLKMPEELSQVEQAVKDLDTAFDGIGPQPTGWGFPWIK